MNIFGKLQDQYDQLWKHIIRPARSPYPETMLGPALFHLEGKKVKRFDFQCTNSRGYVFYASHFVPVDAESYNCVIFLHGNSSNRTEGMEYLGKLIRHDISLCVFDFSGCGNAEGQYVTLGYYEQEDLHEVLTHIKNKPQVKAISIWGRSMGAVTALLYLNKNVEVVSAVIDSPFKSLKSLIEDLVKKNSKIPMLILAAALKIISGTIEEKAKFSIYKINPLKYNVSSTTQPAFFIVGVDDELIPPEHTKQLYSAYAGQDKEIRMVKGKHNDSRPDQCIDDAINFIIRNFKRNSQLKQFQQLTNPTTKTQKQFDFFEATIKQQGNTSNNVDFFAQIKENPQIVATMEKQEFSFSNIFSTAFSQAKKLVKPREKEEENKKKKKKDGYEETESTLKRKFRVEDTKMQQQKRSRKRKEEQRLSEQIATLELRAYERQLQQNLTSWCFV